MIWSTTSVLMRRIIDFYNEFEMIQVEKYVIKLNINYNINENKKRIFYE